MKHQFNFCLFFFGTLVSLCTSAQNENAKWYFGNGAGLDFMTNPPTVLTNGAIYTMEGCSTMSDASGNLLFYTDGISVWNKQHALMSNGTGLGGNSSTTQSALIVKKPGSSSLYYVFTMGTNYPNYGGPLEYSIVDITQASGLGSVITKNVFMDSICTEKLAAARHCNGTDIWIIMHSNHSNSFKTFLLSNTGINLTPVISSVGTFHNSGAIGYLKVSSNGQKLGLAVHFSGFEIYDFDKANGSVSHPLILGGNSQSPYGCEFSPDGSKFYGANSLEQNNPIRQWDLCAGSDQAIVSSQTVIGNVTGVQEVGSFQLANDGKIYVTRYGNNTLCIINNPNNSGTACNFVNLGLSLSPKFALYGLQNCVNDFLKPSSTACYEYDCNIVTNIKLRSPSEDILRIYPNPVTSRLYFETKVSAQLFIMNQTGSVVFESFFEGGEHTIDMSAFDSGIYLAKIVTNEYVKTFRFLKVE